MSAVAEHPIKAAPRDRGDLRALQLAVALYVLLFAVKLAAYFLTGVMALLGEALHTLSDIFIFGFLLVAAIYARKAADTVHMFGYGRAENAASLVAATLFLSFTSFRLYEEAIPQLITAQETTYQNLPLAFGVLIGSMLVVAAPLFAAIRQKQRGAAAKAQLVSLVNDELGLLAALIGTAFVLWGQPLADPIATIIVATIIAVDAIDLFRENASVLLGRSPGPEYLTRVEQVARLVDGVVGVHELRAEYIGPDTIHAGMHIEVSPDLSIREADQIAEEVRQWIHSAEPEGYYVIHVEPARSLGAPPASPGHRLVPA